MLEGGGFDMCFVIVFNAVPTKLECVKKRRYLIAAWMNCLTSYTTKGKTVSKSSNVSFGIPKEVENRQYDTSHTESL